MKISKMKVQDGQLVTTESKNIDQSQLAADCWSIQFDGLSACENCPYVGTKDCGGGDTLKAMQE